MKTITVLIPCYNEEKSLDLLYERMKKLIDDMSAYQFKVLLVNDGSVDHTLDKMQQLHAKDSMVSYLSLSRNFGKEIAMLAGLDYA